MRGPSDKIGRISDRIYALEMELKECLGVENPLFRLNISDPAHIELSGLLLSSREYYTSAPPVGIITLRGVQLTASGI